MSTALEGSRHTNYEKNRKLEGQEREDAAINLVEGLRSHFPAGSTQLMHEIVRYNTLGKIVTIITSEYTPGRKEYPAAGFAQVEEIQYRGSGKNQLRKKLAYTNKSPGNSSILYKSWDEAALDPKVISDNTAAKNEVGELFQRAGRMFDPPTASQNP